LAHLQLLSLVSIGLELGASFEQLFLKKGFKKRNILQKQQQIDQTITTSQMGASKWPS